jgi:hypothetical protein
MPTCGIHVISTTYRTWMPGDARGHWSPLFDFYGRLKESGHRLRLPDPDTFRHSSEIAKEPEMVLSPHAMTIVAHTFRALLTPPHSPPLVAGTALFKPPIVYAAAIERTHFHLLIGILREDLGTFVGRLKGSAASAVLSFPEYAGRTRVWTAHYWEVFLFDERGVDTVQTYVEQHNVRRGLPPSPFDWVHPRRVRSSK